MKIEFKDQLVLTCCLKVRWHNTLIAVLAWMVETFGEIVITEGWRPLAQWKPSDIHCTDPLRAFDIRSWIFKEPEFVEAKINREWIYDPDRPEKNVAFLHDAGSGRHFHIQVHPSTRRRV